MTIQGFLAKKMYQFVAILTIISLVGNSMLPVVWAATAPPIADFEVYEDSSTDLASSLTSKVFDALLNTPLVADVSEVEGNLPSSSVETLGLEWPDDSSNEVLSTDAKVGFSPLDDGPLDLKHIFDSQGANSTVYANNAAMVPTPTEQPLVIARVQSAYTPSGLVSGTVIVTYTAINRLLADELYNTFITVKLASGVTVADAPAHLILPDGSLSFAVGNLPFADGAAVSLKLNAPSTPGPLDTGATATASYANKQVTAQTAAALLIDDSFAAQLGQQPEFMFNDIDLLTVAGLVEQDPLLAFELVRDATNYEPYRGSLRGARGTWWSEAGNALDRSSLLMGILRTIGVPTQYVSGTLTTDYQTTLLSQMFGDTASKIGLISAENEYDPYSDPDLLSLAANHHWIEAYVGNTWQSFDPNFKDATPNAVYGSNATPFLSIPDGERHKTQLTITGEQLPAFLGEAGQLETFTAFDLTLPTAQIAGLPVVVGHFVDSSSSGGAAFYTIQHFYTPFVAIGGIRPDSSIYRGEIYQEMITNFPFGTQRLTAASIDVTISGPGATTETYSDYIVDRIGAAARRYGFSIEQVGGTEPIAKDREGIAIVVAPNWIPERAVTRNYGRAMARTALIEDMYAVLTRTFQISDTTPSPEALKLEANLDGLMSSAITDMAMASALTTLSNSDKMTRQYSGGMKVHAFFETPRVYFAANNFVTATNTIELRHNWPRRDIALVSYPGQLKAAEKGMRMAYDIDAISQEFINLLPISGGYEQIKSVASVFLLALEQDIGLVPIIPQNANMVYNLDISIDAKARILEALQDKGRIVLVPAESVLINGEPYVAWLEIDEETGGIYDQDQDGKHQVAIGYVFVQPANCEGGSGQSNCANEMAVIGAIVGMMTRGLVTMVSMFHTVNVASKGKEHLDVLCTKLNPYSEIKYDQCMSDPRKAATQLDNMVWTLTELILKVMTAGCTGTSAFFSGISTPTLGLNFSKCQTAQLKMAELGIDSLGKIFNLFFDTGALTTLYTSLGTALGTSDPIGFISGGILGFNLSAGGFFQGAALINKLAVEKILKQDPPLPPEVAFGRFTEPQLEETMPYSITLSANLASGSVSGQLSTTHILLQQTDAWQLQGGQLSVKGGPFAAINVSEAILRDNDGNLIGNVLNPAIVLPTDESLVLKQPLNSTLSAGTTLNIGGAKSTSLHSINSMPNTLLGLFHLTATNHLTISVPPGEVSQLHLPPQTLVNAVAYTAGVTLEFTHAVIIDPGQLQWVGNSLNLPTTAKRVKISAFTGTVNSLQNAPALSLKAWTGDLNVTPTNNYLSLTLNGTANWLGSAAPMWTNLADSVSIVPDFMVSESDTYTTTIIANRNNFILPPDVAPDGTVQINRKPTNLSSEIATVGFALREETESLLVFDAIETMPARSEAVAISLYVDELSALPWGPLFVYNLSNSVFGTVITYTGNTSTTFNLSQQGLPADWVYFSEETITLEQGQVVEVSLIVSPTYTLLPLPDTSIPFTVTLEEVNSGSLSAVDNAVWQAPTNGLPGIVWWPNTRNELVQGETTLLTLIAANGGAITDTFNLSTTVSSAGIVTAPITVTIGPRSFVTVPVTFTMQAISRTLVPVEAVLNNGVYGTSDVFQLSSYPAHPMPLIDWAYTNRSYCDGVLADMAFILGEALAFYEMGGVATLDNVQFQAEQVSYIAHTCVDIIATTANVDPNTFTALQLIDDAILLLPEQVTPLVDALNALLPQIEAYQWIWDEDGGGTTFGDYDFEVDINAEKRITRLNQPVAFTATLTHNGSVSGTFIVTLTNHAASTSLTQTMPLAPGEVSLLTGLITPTLEQGYRLSITALRPDALYAKTDDVLIKAFQNFASLLAVRPIPQFVETQNGATTLVADLENYLRYPLTATLMVTMTAPDGNVYYTNTVQSQHQQQVSSLNLGNVTFSNALTGVYTITAYLLEEGITVESYLVAGSGLQAGRIINPQLVLPGDVTTTMVITAQIAPHLINNWEPTDLTPLNTPIPPVIFYTHTFTYHSDITPSTVIYYPNDVTISSNTTWNDDVHISGTLTVNANLTLANGVRTITANNIIVNAGGYVSADYLGYGPGDGPGGGFHAVEAGGSVGKSAGHGGYGEKYQQLQDGVWLAGLAYGDARYPTSMGSGGGSSSSGKKGGDGGGAIHLVVTDTLTIDGIISSNGKDGESTTVNLLESGAGGSGGSVLLETNTLTGNGIIRANGGRGGGTFYANSNAANGAGGRLAIHVQTYSFSGTLQTQGEDPGDPNDVIGAPGTIYININNSFERLIIDQAMSDYAPPAVLMPGQYKFDDIIFNDNGDLTLLGETSILTIELTTWSGINRNYVEIISGFLVAPTNLTIESLYVRTPTLIGVENLTLQNSGYFAFQAKQGRSNIFTFTNLIMHNGGFLALYTDNGDTDYSNDYMEILAKNMTTGYIFALGYPLGVGLSPGEAANQSEGKGGGGGSHAGYGGTGEGGTLGGEIIYGNPYWPITAGSGGGIPAFVPNALDDYWEFFNYGGGAVHLIVTDTLTNTGTINASNYPNSPWSAGGGAGGSIWVDANNLTGNGKFMANAFNVGSPFPDYYAGGGGGGGRIAVYANTNNFTGTLSCTGGQGGNAQAGNGTDGTCFQSPSILILSLDLDHQLPLTGSTVITSTALPTITHIISKTIGDRVLWRNVPITQSTPSKVITVDLYLPAMQPGEVRPIVSHSVLSYTSRSGSGTYHFPTAYVVAPHILNLTPITQSTPIGQGAVYTISLLNPTPQAVSYTLALTDLPAGWSASYANTVIVAPQTTLSVTLMVTPSTAEAGFLDVTASTAQGVAGTALASLQGLIPFQLDVSDPLLNHLANPGQNISYTAFITDLSGLGSVVDLVLLDPFANPVPLANGLIVAPNDSQAINFNFTAPYGAGVYVLLVTANQGDYSQTKMLWFSVQSGPSINAQLYNATTGPAMPVVLTGTVSQSWPQDVLPGANLTVTVPSGWQLLNAPTHLPPGQVTLNTQLTVVPPIGTAAGDYPVVMQAVLSETNGLQSISTATITVLAAGVQAIIEPDTQLLSTGQPFSLTLVVSNSGTVSNTFYLTPTGILSYTGNLAVSQVALAPDESTTVLYSGLVPTWLITGSHLVAMVVQAQSEPNIVAIPTAHLQIVGLPQLELSLQPTSQIVTNTAHVPLSLLLQNTGASDAVPVILTAYGNNNSTVQLENTIYERLLTQGAVNGLLYTTLPQAGTYTITATATTPATSGAVATATIEYRQQILDIYKTVTPTMHVPYHGQVTYTIVLSNVGSANVNGLVLNDTLATNTLFSHWLYQPDGATVTNNHLQWQGALSIGQVISFSFVVSHSGYYGESVLNTAAYTTPTDLAGQAQATFIVEGAPLPHIDKQVDIINPVPGQQITYQVVISNHTLNTLTNTIISDTLSPYLTLAGPITVMPTGSVIFPTQLPWLVNNLNIAAGDYLTLTVPVTVSTGLVANTLITNTAALSYATMITAINSSVLITVANAGPVAENSYYYTPQDTPLIEQLVATDANSDSLTFSIVNAPLNGSVSLSNALSGTFIYTPTTNFKGNDIFSFMVTDSAGLSDVGQVLIGVAAANNPPFAFDDIVVTARNQAIDIFVLSNDYDPDGDLLTIDTVTPPNNGLVNSTPLSITYTPNTDYTGLDIFTYTVSDGFLSDQATIAVVITGSVSGNMPPQFNSNPLTTATESVLYTYIISTTDIEGDALSISATNLPAWLTVLDNGDGTAILSGVPLVGSTGSYLIILMVSDGVNTSYQLYTLMVKADGSTVVPGLSLSKTAMGIDGVTNLPLNSLLTYTLILSNSGQTDITNIVLSDTLPSGVSFNAWLEQDTATLTNNTIQWQGTLAAQTQLYLRFTVIITSSTIFAGQHIINKAMYYSPTSGFGQAEAEISLVPLIFLPIVLK